jgi:uncharacterized membrane protein
MSISRVGFLTHASTVLRRYLFRFYGSTQLSFPGAPLFPISGKGGRTGLRQLKIGTPHVEFTCSRFDFICKFLPWCAARYSYRNAIIGSTRITRRAGIKHDPTATTPSNAATAINVTGSVALTP